MRQHLLAAVVGTVVIASPLGAQERFAFSVGMGYAKVAGGWGEALTDGIDSDINITYLFSSGVKVGAGAYYVSYDVQPQFGEESVSNVQLQGILGYVLRFGRWRPYVQARGTFTRLRLEGQHGGTPPPEEEGENTQPQQTGFGGVAVAGVELLASRYVTLDAGAWFGAFSTQEVDLSPIGGTTFSDGRSWGVRLSIVWYPNP